MPEVEAADNKDVQKLHMYLTKGVSLSLLGCRCCQQTITVQSDPLLSCTAVAAQLSTGANPVNFFGGDKPCYADVAMFSALNVRSAGLPGQHTAVSCPN